MWNWPMTGGGPGRPVETMKDFTGVSPSKAVALCVLRLTSIQREAKSPPAGGMAAVGGGGMYGVAVGNGIGVSGGASVGVGEGTGGSVGSGVGVAEGSDGGVGG